MLKNEKEFIRSVRKHQKEFESLKKRQHKEKTTIQKQQCLAIDKIVKLNKTEDIGNEPIVKELVADQMKQWSDMIERHHKEEWDLLKNQITQQGDLLKRLLMISQSAQIKLLESIFERENKELKAKQAKISVETAKEVFNDKTLKNKAERERRLKEKK